MPKLERSQNCIQVVMDNGNVVMYSRGGKSVFDIDGKRIFCGKGGSKFIAYQELSDDEILKQHLKE